MQVRGRVEITCMKKKRQGRNSSSRHKATVPINKQDQERTRERENRRTRECLVYGRAAVVSRKLGRREYRGKHTKNSTKIFGTIGNYTTWSKVLGQTGADCIQIHRL